MDLTFAASLYGCPVYYKMTQSLTVHTFNISHVSFHRMLGYTQALRTAYGSTYGIARGIIWLSEVNCIGNETNIAQCSFPGWGINNCYHWRDVNVICDSELFTNRRSSQQRSFDDVMDRKGEYSVF